MQSIDRAMKVINVLAKNMSKGGLNISMLSQESELPLSTMHRLLKAMTKKRLIERDEDSKTYRLGTIWLEYGLQLYETMDYLSNIKPELELLMLEVEESVYLNKPAGLEAIVVQRIDSENNPIRIYDQLGVCIPMHIGAANKAMLANMSMSQSNDILSKLIPSEQIAEMKAQLKTIKKQGYAISHGERTSGTSSVAVAIHDGFGEVIGAISIGFVSFNLTERRLTFLIEKATQTGRKISIKFGYQSI